ncbi:sporulation protein YpjB [Oceanobacillus halotolerans]|uniref:sporulation protein YpjB n=1 Tax=Oceanobacillus halotolerans TaxID=2663380 RepID=UPI0013D93F01|nr:sporulation protein YpjB [Oceanobacillus halotolerans]
MKQNSILFAIVLIGIFFFIDMDNSVLAENNTPVVENPSSKKNNDMVPFYWLVIIVGGSIAVTLSYVGWRKYKGEQNRKAKKDSI